MSAFGVELGWLALRVSLVAVIAVMMIAVMRRFAARGAVTLLAGVMVILLGMSVVAVCPLPESWRWTVALDAATTEVEHQQVSDPSGAKFTGVELGAADAQLPATARLGDVLAWLAALPGPASLTVAWQRAWMVIAWIYLAGVSVGVLRLLASWRALITLRRQSIAITDRDLLLLAGQVRDELGIAAVPLRENPEPGLAATLGWRLPVILLPPEWRTWSVDERRAVLAHEFAHVRHRDFLIGVIAGVCRAVHFYHPLVRWLAGQLRRRQEVAADDLAASAAGGRAVYLKTLARLALRLPARTPAGAALILPAMTGGALLWRIRMLGQTERRPLNRTLRGLLIAGLAAAAVFITGWRGSAGSPRQAAPPVQAEDRAAPTPFELGYLLPDSKGLVAVRPSVWIQQPGMDVVARKIDELFAAARKAGVIVPDIVRPENIEQIVTNLHLSTDGNGKPGSRRIMFGTSSLLVRFHKEVDGPALLRLVSEHVKEIRKGDAVLYQLGVIPELGPLPVTMFMPDRRTLVLVGNKDEKAAEALAAGAAAARKRDWGTGWKSVARAPFALVLDNRDNNYGKRFAKDLEQVTLMPEKPFRDIVENIRFATVGIELGDGRPVRVVIDAKSPEIAAALDKFGGEYLVQRLAVLKQQLDGNDPAEKLGLKLASELVETRQVNLDGSRLEWLGFSTVRVRHLLEVDGLVGNPATK